MTKIKTLIAHNDRNIAENIVNEIEELEYVEVVGSAKTGKETFDKIIELKPEIVFLEYNMGDMDVLEMMEKIADYFGKEEAPLFKFIANNISENKTINKYELNKKENEKNNKKEEVFIKGIGTQGIIEELEKYLKEKGE